MEIESGASFVQRYERHKCPYCNSSFYYKYNLSTHIKQEHKGGNNERDSNTVS